MRFLILLAGLLVQAALAQSPSKPLRVLFIGNAILASTDIPGRVASLAQATGRAAKIEAITSTGYSLEDHLREGKAAQALRQGWDFVVLQQDAPAADEAADFARPVKRLAGAIREAGARPALFMAWPRGDRMREIREAIVAQRDASSAAGAMPLPVAEAWLRALAADRRLKLHTGSGPQPSPFGTDLAVLTVYLALFPAQDFDEAFVDKVAQALGTPAATRDLLFDAATRALDEPLALEKPRSP